MQAKIVDSAVFMNKQLGSGFLKCHPLLPFHTHHKKIQFSVDRLFFSQYSIELDFSALYRWECAKIILGKVHFKLQNSKFNNYIIGILYYSYSKNFHPFGHHSTRLWLYYIISIITYI